MAKITITIKSKKIISLIIPKIFGIVILKIQIGEKVKKHLWAIAAFSKTWWGFCK